MRLLRFTYLHCYWICLLSASLGGTTLLAQPLIEVGGGITPEISWGAANSSIYYNDLHPNWTTGRIGIREANALLSLNPAPALSLHSRVQLRRQFGNQLTEWVLVQAHARWHSKGKKWRLDLGRFLSPFGALYKRALPQDRLLITNPLFYQYYTNISYRVGYSPQLGEPSQLFVDGRRDWGVTHAYYGGYSTGVALRHTFKQDSAFVDVAIVNGAPAVSQSWSQPIHPSVIIHGEWRPTYFWQQGFSASYGGFLQESSLTDSLEGLGNSIQLMLGADWRLGYQYLEFSGELIGSWYKVPVFDGATNQFTTSAAAANWLVSWGGYADLRVDMPFLVGGYAIYRFGYLGFGQGPDTATPWDDASWRHSIGLGYKITRNILLKSVYAHQQVVNQEWQLDQWRTSLNIYF